jgi:hypothetical protein
LRSQSTPHIGCPNTLTAKPPNVNAISSTGVTKIDDSSFFPIQAHILFAFIVVSLQFKKYEDQLVVALHLTSGPMQGKRDTGHGNYFFSDRNQILMASDQTRLDSDEPPSPHAEAAEA